MVPLLSLLCSSVQQSLFSVRFCAILIGTILEQVLKTFNVFTLLQNETTEMNEALEEERKANESL